MVQAVHVPVETAGGISAGSPAADATVVAIGTTPWAMPPAPAARPVSAAVHCSRHGDGNG